VRRYFGLLGVQLRTSLVLAAQYRWDFLLEGLVSLAWIVLGIVPLYVALHQRPPAFGWTYEQALVVLGWFTLLKAILDGAVTPSLNTVVEHIRKGTLDFVLIKPADAQFLVSTARFEPWRALDWVAGAGIVAWAFRSMGTVPRSTDIGLAAVLLAASVAVLYSIWILVVAAAFWVVRLDNLSYLLNSVIDFARWPVHVFKGTLRFVFTFVIPLALMTTYPAEALLGRLAPQTALLAMLGSLVFASIGRMVWTRAVSQYSSASS
jgi:ABC-2 type transport system permease protein